MGTSELPRVGDTVYEKCDQDSPLVWGELPQDWMPDDQLLIVWIFRSVGVGDGMSTIQLSRRLFFFFLSHRKQRGVSDLRLCLSWGGVGGNSISNIHCLRVL